MSETELFRFGAFADLQYGDWDDRQNYSGTRNRFYRNSLEILKRSVDIFCREKVDFVIQLGDLIDGFNAFEFNSTQAAYADVMSIIRTNMPDVPFFHVIGNHELYNFPRTDLHFTLPFPETYELVQYNCRNSRAAFFKPQPKIGFIIIDTYEFSMLGYPEESIYAEARDFLSSHNGHDDLNSPALLEGLKKRFVKFNGALSSDQVNWLENILSKCDDENISIMIAGHLPIFPDACDPVCLEWRYEELLLCLQRHKSVKAYFAGHNHDGGYAVDSVGIHHITFPGVIETEPGVDCFGIVKVFDTHLNIEGFGRVASRLCQFRQ